MIRVLRWAAIALAGVVVLGAGAAFFMLRDPGAIVARLAPAVERATGRQLTVGTIAPDFFGGGVTLRDVALRSRDPDTAPQEITAETVRASLSWLALLSGRVDIRAIEVDGATAAFETDAAGALHVGVGPAPNAAAAAAHAADKPAAADRKPENYCTVAFTNVVLTLRNRAAGTEERATIASARLTTAPDGVCAATGDGTIRGVKLAFAASAGPLAAGATPLKASISVGPDHAAFDGTVGRTVAGLVTLSLPDPSVVTPLLGQVDLPPVELSGHVEGTAAKAAFDLHGTAYGSSVHAVGDAVASPRPALHATVAANRLDPAAWTRARPAPAAAPASAPASAGEPPPAAGSPAARPAPDLAALKGFDADVTLTAGVIEPGVKDFAAHMILAGGVLTADPIAATYAGVTASGRATLDANASPPRATVLLPGVKIPAAALAAYLPVLRGASGVADLHADLRAAGLDAAAMEASLSGRLGVAMVEGGLAPQALAPILAAAKLPVALPQALTSVRCLAVRADFTDGEGRVEDIVLDGAALRLTGGGSLDLRRQTLALRLHPLLRAAGFGLSVPVTVSGPISAPRVAPDISPGAAAGRDAAGLVIGALQAAAGEGSDPCPAALAAARFLAAPGTAPAAAPPPPVKLPKPADLLRGLFR